MAKNAYARQIQARIRQERADTQAIVRQMVIDMAQVTLGRLGYGAKRQKDFHDKLMEVYTEYADLFNADVLDDPDFVYGKACLDRELKEYCGEYFAPWEERYRL